MEFSEARSCIMLFVVFILYNICVWVDTLFLCAFVIFVLKQPLPRQDYIILPVTFFLMVIGWFQMLAIIRFYEWSVERRNKKSSASDFDDKT